MLGKEFGVIGAAVKGQAAFEQLLFEHSRSISSFLASVMRASVAGAPLEEHVAQLTSLVRSQEKKWAEASKTRCFYLEDNIVHKILLEGNFGVHCLASPRYAPLKDESCWTAEFNQSPWLVTSASTGSFSSLTFWSMLATPTLLPVIPSPQPGSRWRPCHARS